MQRQQYIPFHQQPIMLNLNAVADQAYRGFFHYHQGLELLYIHQGEGNVIVNQRLYSMQPGKLFIFQPGQLHRVQIAPSSEQAYRRSVIHFEPTFVHQRLASFPSLQKQLERLWKGNIATPVFSRLDRSTPIESILTFQQKNIATQSSDALETAIILLIQLFNCLQYSQAYAEQEMEHAVASQRVQSHTELILEWIEAHFMDPFELDALAKQLHLSKFYASRLFKAETGSTITQYITARRVKEACFLLTTTSLTVEQIGQQAGWADPSHFIQVFRRHTGRTPLQFRKQSEHIYG